ncbi:hypothetical protein bcere0014_48670 [Bacillus cereus BDRD-ST196]|nr:hypothetical protein bcere0014_48670 [Bacillus cereus BDRD-ST196]
MLIKSMYGSYLQQEWSNENKGFSFIFKCTEKYFEKNH